MRYFYRISFDDFFEEGRLFGHIIDEKKLLNEKNKKLGINIYLC